MASGPCRRIFTAVAGYGPDVAKNREQARALMKKAGYGPDKHLHLKVATRGISLYKDPAVILAGQLKEIWIDADVDIIETAQWFPKIARKDLFGRPQHDRQRRRRSRPEFLREFLLQVGAQLHRLLQSEIEKLFDVQSQETDVAKRKKVVWESTRSCSRTGRWPIIMWNRAAICMQPFVKGYVPQVNSVYNGFRFEGRLARRQRCDSPEVPAVALLRNDEADAQVVCGRQFLEHPLLGLLAIEHIFDVRHDHRQIPERIASGQPVELVQ